MSLKFDELFTGALSLDARERAKLAESLWLSADNATQTDVRDAWESEIARRMADLDAGRASTRPVQDVIDRLRRKTSS